MILGFRKSGITDKAQQDIILNGRLQDLYIVHDIEEFTHIEKDSDVNPVNFI